MSIKYHLSLHFYGKLKKPIKEGLFNPPFSGSVILGNFSYGSHVSAML